jgi:uncharacterized protein
MAKVPSCIVPVANGFFLSILAKPGSKSFAITSIDEMIGVSIQAPPREGEANSALVDYMATVLKKKRREVMLVKGAKSRNKTLKVETNESAAEIYEKLVSAKNQSN